MIFQDPLTSLNPLFRIDQHFLETMFTHEKDLKKAEAFEKAEQMLESLGISPDRLLEYPHQLSGGMRQRIMIGLGLILQPDLLIADEPTTALDVIVEAQFLDLLADLQQQFNLTIILITHNLGNVAQLADRISVMYGGNMVEVAEANSIFENPLHPYTQGLLASIPNIKLEQPKLQTMPGSPPDLVNPPSGCVFHPRCPQAMGICKTKKPETKTKDGHLVSCWLY
jgi:oligopeptide/dipeptide ABC transporter ATP-binding protein